MPLSITLPTLREDVGRLLGFGTDEASFSAAQDADVMRCISAGLEDFYQPQNGHQWSFLTVTQSIPTWGNVTGTISAGSADTLTATGLSTDFHPSMVGEVIVADTAPNNQYTIMGYTSPTVVVVDADPTADIADTFTITKSSPGNYTLASGFGAIEGPLTYATGTTIGPVILTSETAIRHMRQTADVTGNPRFAAVRPLASFDQTDQQRFELLIYPRSSTVYDLSYRNRVNPLVPVASTREHFYGGMHHAGTISEACLAAAERLFFDEAGLHNAEYQRRLEKSLALDRRMIQPEVLIPGPGRSTAFSQLRSASITWDS